MGFAESFNSGYQFGFAIRDREKNRLEEQRKEASKNLYAAQVAMEEGDYNTAAKLAGKGYEAVPDGFNVTGSITDSNGKFLGFEVDAPDGKKGTMNPNSIHKAIQIGQTILGGKDYYKFRQDIADKQRTQNETYFTKRRYDKATGTISYKEIDPNTGKIINKKLSEKEFNNINPGMPYITEDMEQALIKLENARVKSNALPRKEQQDIDAKDQEIKNLKTGGNLAKAQIETESMRAKALEEQANLYNQQGLKTKAQAETEKTTQKLNLKKAKKAGAEAVYYETKAEVEKAQTKDEKDIAKAVMDNTVKIIKNNFIDTSTEHGQKTALMSARLLTTICREAVAKTGGLPQKDGKVYLPKRDYVKRLEELIKIHNDYEKAKNILDLKCWTDD